MGAPAKETFQLGIPPELREEVEAAFREAAAQQGVKAYEISALDKASAESELQFEPGTVLLVLKFVAEAAGAALVGKAVEILLKKLKPRPEGAVRIVIMYPDGEVETVDTGDVRQTNAVIARLQHDS